eukprot:1777704-Pleurochrysis_carterae.AAC.2
MLVRNAFNRERAPCACSHDACACAPRGSSAAPLRRLASLVPPRALAALAPRRSPRARSAEPSPPAGAPAPCRQVVHTARRPSARAPAPRRAHCCRRRCRHFLRPHCLQRGPSCWAAHRSEHAKPNAPVSNGTRQTHALRESKAPMRHVICHEQPMWRIQ